MEDTTKENSDHMEKDSGTSVSRGRCGCTSNWPYTTLGLDGMTWAWSEPFRGEITSFLCFVESQ